MGPSTGQRFWRQEKSLAQSIVIILTILAPVSWVLVKTYIYNINKMFKLSNSWQKFTFLFTCLINLMLVGIKTTTTNEPFG